MKHYYFLFIALSIALTTVQAAEDDFLLLTLDSNLIGPLAAHDGTIRDGQQAAELLDAYHQLLAAEVHSEVASLHEQLLKFIPGFEVAYTAADSAEISHIMSEMDMLLAAIQRIHAEYYTQEVTDLLTQAYQLVLPTFGD